MDPLVPPKKILYFGPTQIVTFPCIPLATWIHRDLEKIYLYFKVMDDLRVHGSHSHIYAGHTRNSKLPTTLLTPNSWENDVDVVFAVW